MPYRIGDRVTIAADARNPHILEMQYYGKVADRTDRGVYVDVGNTVTFGAPGRSPGEFGPFRDDQLLADWRDRDGRPRL